MTGRELWETIEEKGISKNRRMQKVKTWLLPFMTISVPHSLILEVESEMGKIHGEEHAARGVEEQIHPQSYDTAEQVRSKLAQMREELETLIRQVDELSSRVT